MSRAASHPPQRRPAEDRPPATDQATCVLLEHGQERGRQPGRRHDTPRSALGPDRAWRTLAAKVHASASPRQPGPTLDGLEKCDADPGNTVAALYPVTRYFRKDVACCRHTKGSSSLVRSCCSVP